MNHLSAAEDLIRFIDASPSPFHACATAAARLDASGFTHVAETDQWPGDAGLRGYVVRDGGLVAWSIPAGAGATTPFRIIGAHSDSPNLRVKPHPDVSRSGAQLVAVEVYGSALFNSWLDRDLGLSGRVAVHGGDLRLVKIDRPLARIPQLAIHLDREVNNGLTLNPQQHLTPMWSIDSADFRGFIASECGVERNEVLYWDLMFHDVTPGAVIGRDGEFISAARIDNLCSCWAGIDALSAGGGEGDAITVVALFDHEEVGSSSNRGAASPLLESALERITTSLGGSREDWRRALAASVCLSADMAHATHPNYSERHDPNHHIALNGGPVVKTNVSQRYATDAHSATRFLEVCAGLDIPVQYYVHRNDMVCGSTIGPITAARLGIATLDVGAPQLSMHSARELMGTDDAENYRRALTAFLSA